MTARKPHVVVVEPISRLGGAERSLIALIAATIDHLSFTVLLPETGELETELTAVGATVEIVPWSRTLLALGERSAGYTVWSLSCALPGLYRAVRDVRTAMERLSPDVVVTNGIKPHFVGSLAAGRRPRWPVIWYLRDSLDGRALSRRLFSRVSGRVRGAVAISNYIAADARTYLDPSIPVSVIYNIVDLSEQVQGHATPLPPKAHDSIWFATIGALTPLKGQDLFLRAAVRVSAELPEARFLVVGSASYQTETHLKYDDHLKQLTSELGLSEKVLFLGHRGDVAALLEQIDVVVQPNRGPEGFGRSVAEAMAAGIPVVASDGWGLAELVDDGSTGWLVPTENIDRLAHRMIITGSDRELRHRLGANGRARARKSFSQAQSAHEFHQLITAICPNLT